MSGIHSSAHASPRAGSRFGRAVVSFIGVIGELLIAVAVVAFAYVAWQTFWTGVESTRTQDQQLASSGWSRPGGGDPSKVAKPQEGEPPAMREPSYGDLLGQLFIPRFGSTWQRNLVEGTDLTQLARHGLGHYEGTALPGQVGLFAVAGHRAGYGEPLAYIDTLREGDYIVMRTADYWYVYKYYEHKIVTPDQGEAISPVPFQPGKTPTERLMALSTCEPRYYTGWGETPYRWVAYAKFQYWAKVSDGTPAELLDSSSTGSTQFTIGSGTIVDGAARALPDNDRIMAVLAAMYVVLFAAAAITWRWPALAEWKRRHDEGTSSFGLYAWLARLQPGPRGMRAVLLALLIIIAFLACMLYLSPWAASNIPLLRTASNFATISGS